MEIRKIAVIGSGLMGSGIAQTAAQSGYEVLLDDVNEEHVRNAIGKIEKRLDRRVADGKLDDAERDRILSRMRASSHMEECAEAGLIIEAVTEQEDIKREIFRKLDRVCPPETIFASNTSSIPITRLGRTTKRPHRFIGMHFMNPAYIMKLIEVVRGQDTSENTVDAVKAVSWKMGKTPVVVRDLPGFVSNRVLMPMINEAIYCLQEDVASKESIDTVMKLGANHPMGPLELADFIGLDTCLEILGILHSEIGEKFRPCPLLEKMVAEGRLGRKSGEGFYEYK